MSTDSAITYTSVHSEARSWSIPSEDPYEEAAQQLLEQAPHSPEYIPDPMELEDHVPVYIPEPEHPEDLVPAEDEAPTPPLPPFFLSPHHIILHYRVAATLPSSSPPPENVESLKDNIRETMTTVDQGMSVEEIERVIAERVANAIEAIAIYETKTNMARKSISQTEQQECKVAGNANNKRKWEGNHNGQCTIKGGNCKKVDHMTRECRNPTVARNQRTHTCYKCGSLRHFKSKCPIVKFQKRVDKKISTLSERQAENKRKLNNTSKNNQNQQQPNKRQNTGKDYAAGHGEKKYYGGSKPLCPKCNYHHDGPCPPKCHRCNIVGHLVRNCRRPTNDNTTNNQRGTGTSQKIFISGDGIKLFLLIMFLLVMFSFLLTEIESAGHVLVSADRDRICYGTNGRTKSRRASNSLIHRTSNELDPRDVKIASLTQRIQELEFPHLQQDSPAEEAETEFNIWDDGSEDVNHFGGGNPGFHDDHYDNPLLTKKTESEPIIWDIGDEEDEYPFVNIYPSFQEEPIVLVEEESYPVYDIDNKEEVSMPVYDTDIEDVIEEEEGFDGKGKFGGEEDNIEDIVVVANDLCSLMIQTILNVDFEEDINTKSHEMMSFGKRDTNLDATSTRDE
ncbi:reverse transcriptase domain-containing protein [Tanacetum coccineum]